VRIIDVLRFVGNLVIVLVEPGEEECDGNVVSGVVGVVAASVDVVVTGPGRFLIEA
jgi:hypothetical protein